MYDKQTWLDTTGSKLNRYKDQNNQAYEFTWWPDASTVEGTPFTAARMNHIENGLFDDSRVIEQNLAGWLSKNLYRGSQDWNMDVLPSTVTVTADTYNGCKVATMSKGWQRYGSLIPLVAGKTYTFSCWLKASAATRVFIYAASGQVGATAVTNPTGSKAQNLTTSWQRFYFTFTCTTSGTANVHPEGETDGITISMAGFMLEEGDTMSNYAAYVPSNIEINEKAMPKSGGTFTGIATATSMNRPSANLRNISVYSNGGGLEVSTNSIIMHRK